MIMDIGADRAREAIIEQASAWFLRHRSGELSHADKSQFLEWLRASQLNLREYLEQVRLHQAFAQTLPGLHLDRERLLVDIQDERRTTILSLNAAEAAAENALTLRRSYPGRRVLTAMAAALVLAVSGLWIYRAFFDAQRISVPHGEQRIVQLPDGSTMHVNVSSRVEVKYSGRARVIELDQGQVFLTVARDARRPFKVHAGGVEVVAVGTQFDVYRRQDEKLIVTVVQGKVDVIDPQWTEGPSDSAAGTARVRVAAGEQVQIDRTAALPVARPADARAATAWLRREVIFNGESLAAVADEINRYIAVPVYIEDENLGKMRVRAVFNAYDSESFLAFLRQYDVVVEEGPAAIRVRAREPGVSE